MFPRKVETVGLVVAALAIATLAAGWVTHRPVMSEAQASPAADKPKVDEKTGTKAAKPIVGVEELGAALWKPVEYPGTDGPDPRVTLDEALDQFWFLFGVGLTINEKAFEADGVEMVWKAPVAAKEGLPKMQAPLIVVLRKVLSKVENKSGAAFLVRKDKIEVTTEAAALREIGYPATADSTARLLPLVYQSSKPVSLEKALADHADASGFNVVLDPRAAEKGKGAVSIRLTNVPIDTALRVLADTAGLSVVRMDNVFYVTTPDNAKKLTTEMPPNKPGERRAKPAGAP
jgi:hypothetical protein